MENNLNYSVTQTQIDFLYQSRTLKIAHFLQEWKGSSARLRTSRILLWAQNGWLKVASEEDYLIREEWLQATRSCWTPPQHQLL
jgi:hypothetical protein